MSLGVAGEVIFPLYAGFSERQASSPFSGRPDSSIALK
jgi:hypothetical protein